MSLTWKYMTNNISSNITNWVGLIDNIPQQKKNTTQYIHGLCNLKVSIKLNGKSKTKRNITIVQHGGFNTMWESVTEILTA